MTTRSVEDIWGGQVTTRVGGAAMAFSMYDMVIHLDDEINLIWCGPNGLIKWAYLFVRHVPYIAQVVIHVLLEHRGSWNSQQCRMSLVWQNIVVESLTIAVEMILVIRVYAMYNRNRTILAILLFLMMAEVGAMCGMLALTVPRFRMSARCLVASTPRLFPFFWLLPLAFETTLFVLTLVKFFTSISIRRQHMGKHSIMFVLVRDGTWAYGIIFVVMLLNTVFYAVSKTPLAGVCFFMEISVLSFAGSHILLNLRRLALHPHGTSFWTNNNCAEFSSVQYETYDLSTNPTDMTAVNSDEAFPSPDPERIPNR